MYHFPGKSEEPVEKKARKSLAPAQEHDREVRPLFSGQDIQPPRPSQEYYPHDHFGSDPRYFGFNKQRFIPNQERSEHHLSLHNADLPVGPPSRKRGRGMSQPRPSGAPTQRQIPQVRKEHPAPINALPPWGRSSHRGSSSSSRGRPTRGRGAGYTPPPRIPCAVQSQLDLLIQGEDVSSVKRVRQNGS